MTGSVAAPSCTSTTGASAANRAATDPVTGLPRPVLPDHPTYQVVLGLMPAGDRPRWPNNREISSGVLVAVHRALDGRPPTVHQVGEISSWARHF